MGPPHPTPSSGASDTIVQWIRNAASVSLGQCTHAAGSRSCVLSSRRLRSIRIHIQLEVVMFKKTRARVRRSRFAVAAAVLGTVLVGAVSWAIAAQDKYTLQVPNGLAFSDFKGYEDWQVVAVSQTDALLKVMVANPTMIAAYKAGIPGNGKPFPDGSK